MKLKEIERIYLIVCLIFLIVLYVFLFIKLIPLTQKKELENINSIIEIREVELKAHEEKTKNIIKDIDIFLSDNPVIKHI